MDLGIPVPPQGFGGRPNHSLVRVPVILIVDDDPANLRVFERVFGRAGRKYTVLGARSGMEAIELATQREVDVAFVDLAMPGMDGRATLAELRRHRPVLPCYLLTGYGDLPETAELVHQGLCRGILAKPWDRDAIEAAIREATG